MKLFNPKTWQGRHPDFHSNEMLRAVVDWFEARGLKQLKQDWHERTWNHDFVEFMQEHQVLSTLMTPEGYGENAAWNTLRNVEFAEIAAFYGITYWYTFQVSMLGLGPVFKASRSGARAIKLLVEAAGMKTLARQQASGVVAFWTEPLDPIQIARALEREHYIIVAQGQGELKGRILRASPIGKSPARAAPIPAPTKAYRPMVTPQTIVQLAPSVAPRLSNVGRNSSMRRTSLRGLNTLVNTMDGPQNT